MAYTQTPILALIGGIGCGKSAVAGWLAEHLRARVVDADVVGHAALLREDVKRQLVEAFGEDILSAGEINRSAVARRVFGETDEHRTARQTLESIVHPVMRTDFEAAFAAARAASDVDLIVFDAAVLLESGWQQAVDVIAYVDVPFASRLQRVADSRGWSAEELRRREASQWSLERKRAEADLVIDNSGTLEAAGQQLETYLQSHGFLPEPTRQLIN